jgi:hypothetical protein
MRSITMKDTLIVLIGLALLFGCGTAISKGEVVRAPSKDEAVIVLGMGFGATNFAAFSAIAAQNGQFGHIHGVVRAQYANKDKRNEDDVDLSEASDYVEASGNTPTYRYWEVQRHQKVLVYVTSAIAANDVVMAPFYSPPNSSFWAFYSPILSVPLTFWNPGQKFYMEPIFRTYGWDTQDALWKFIGCSATIDGSGIYYLGDISLGGLVTTGEKKAGNLVSFNQYKIDSLSISVGSSSAGLKTQLAKNKLASVPLFEKADACREISGKDWWAYVLGQK